MTPREVEQLTADEYDALLRYAIKETRDANRAARAASRRR